MDLQVVYTAFLSQIDADEWSTWEDYEREEDWFQLLLSAIFQFKFPRVSLEINEDKTAFIDEKVSNAEVQVLAGYMKLAWLSRVVNSWEALRPMYQERDFSPANMLKEYRGKEADQLQLAKQLEAKYYRSIEGKPYRFSKLYWRGKK